MPVVRSVSQLNSSNDWSVMETRRRVTNKTTPTPVGICQHGPLDSPFRISSLNQWQPKSFREINRNSTRPSLTPMEKEPVPVESFIRPFVLPLSREFPLDP
jgi:hypothetical protein